MIDKKKHGERRNGFDNRVKINKIEKTTICEKWLQLLQECQSHSQKDRKEFIYVYCNYKKNLKMRINEL
jgi:hypothetical protein